MELQVALYNLIFSQEKRFARALYALLFAKFSAIFLYSPTITVKYLATFSKISLAVASTAAH